MTKEIIKLVVLLALLAAAVKIPEYRDYLNPLIGAAVGYFYAKKAETLEVLRGAK